MTKYLFLVYSNAFDGRDDEFNKWYDETHIADVLSLPGFVGARRYAVEGKPFQGPAPQHKYLVVYEIEADDPQVGLAEMARRAADPEENGIVMCDAFDLGGAVGILYRQLGSSVGVVA